MAPFSKFPKYGKSEIDDKKGFNLGHKQNPIDKMLLLLYIYVYGQQLSALCLLPLATYQIAL